MDRIRYLVVHHSASPGSLTVEQIRDMHMDRGFEDIGYSLVILANGEIQVGRPLPLEGAHCPPHNDESIGVCLVGWMPVRHPWTPEQRVALRRVVRSARIFWPALEVVGHRDVGSTPTECPGISREQLEVMLA